MAEDLTGSKDLKEKAKQVGKNTSKTSKAASSGVQKVKIKNEQLIYVGPNVRGGRLSRFTVFKGGIPEYLNDLITEQPQMKRLIVPVQEMSNTLKNIGVAGTWEHQAFQDIAKGAE